MAGTVKKTTKKEEVTTPVVEEVKKTTTKKTTTKKAAAKEEVAAKEEAVVEEKAAPAKKAAAKKDSVKVSVTLQFAEKSYTEEDLVNIAKDVWKFDLSQNDADLKTVELYVKPEEGLCYYVFNSDMTGSFVI